MSEYRRNHRTFCFLLLIFSALFLLQACSSEESKVIGKWKVKGGSEVMEFFKDGKVSIVEEGKSAIGKWSPSDDGRIRVEVPVFGTNVFMTVTVIKDTLKMEMGNRSAEYKRLP